MNDNEKVAKEFWTCSFDYPSYPNTLKRRLIDTNFVTKYVYDKRSIADIGCGTGSMILALRLFTCVTRFYAYDLSDNFLCDLRDRWGYCQDERLTSVPVDFNNFNSDIKADAVLSLGLFPYIFEENKISNLLSKIDSDLLIVRAPCTMKDEDEVINKYSEDLKEDYAAVYRTVDNYIDILSNYFEVINVTRAYPDNIESKYGTKHFFFVCVRN